MQQKRIYQFVWIIALAVLILPACKTKKQQVATGPPPEKTAFYTIEALRDTVKQITTFKVLKVTVVDTKINYHIDEAKTKTRDFLKIEIVGKQVSSIVAYCEHPLFKKFDLYEQTGEITSKLISLPKGQVTVRVPWFEEYQSIKITETINFKEANHISLKHEK
jgi:hypothetical protein